MGYLYSMATSRFVVVCTRNSGSDNPLQAANVLINDYGHCIISDFGQSELKSEAYRLSGTPLPRMWPQPSYPTAFSASSFTDGTLRWQAPELMAGRGKLTPEVDIYAFAITCVELLTKGSVPWPLADDNAVRHFVLGKTFNFDLFIGAYK